MSERDENRAYDEGVKDERERSVAITRLTEAHIKHMVSRFLGWKLPTNFNPDDGISFDPISNRGRSFERRREPTGTNLFDAEQADAMVRYMLEGICARCLGLHGTTGDCSGPKRPSQPLNHTPYG